jgi:glycosyltransferase involved in cell wall biosynthesis
MILDPAGNMWGSERVLLDFLGSETAQKRNLGLCCPPDTPLASEAEKVGIAVYPFFKAKLHEKGKLSRLSAAMGLTKACKQYKADIIYVNQAGASRIALFVGRLLKKPVIPHVRLLEDVRYIESLRATTREMPRVLVISKFIGDAFEISEMKQRVKILYDAYAMTKRYEFTSSLSQTSTEFCCAGRLVPIKGQNILIQAMAELCRIGVKVSLNLYGEGLPGRSFEVDLVKLIEKLNLNSEVIFHGFVSDIPAEMHRHRAVICPSHTEPLGRIIFEAWDSASLPIVGSFSGGAAEVVNASQGGLLYNEQTPESLADTIKECLKLSPQERTDMIDRGRQWLQANCNPEEYSRELLKILDMGIG